MGMLLYVGLAWQSLHYGLFATNEKPWHNTTKMNLVGNKPPSSSITAVLNTEFSITLQWVSSVL